MFYRYKLSFMESNMYMLFEEDAALIIDPQSSQEAVQEIKKHSVQHITVLLTHEHFDHTSGVNFLRDECADIEVMAHPLAAKFIKEAKNNRPLTLLTMVNDSNRGEVLASYSSYSVTSVLVDKTLEDKETIDWKSHQIQIHYVPGHSPGGVLIVLDDKYLFSGDYMIPDTPVILRYPGGSKKEYIEKTLPYLLHLPKHLTVLPGHGEPYKLQDMEYDYDKNGFFHL